VDMTRITMTDEEVENFRRADRFTVRLAQLLSGIPSTYYPADIDVATASNIWSSILWPILSGQSTFTIPQRTIRYETTVEGRAVASAPRKAGRPRKTGKGAKAKKTKNPGRF
jgi:hypothetical protein